MTYFNMTYGRKPHSRWVWLHSCRESVQELERKTEKHVRANQGNTKTKIGGQKKWCTLPNQKLSGIFRWGKWYHQTTRWSAQKPKSWWTIRWLGGKCFHLCCSLPDYSCVMPSLALKWAVKTDKITLMITLMMS